MIIRDKSARSFVHSTNPDIIFSPNPSIHKSVRVVNPCEKSVRNSPYAASSSFDAACNVALEDENVALRASSTAVYASSVVGGYDFDCIPCDASDRIYNINSICVYYCLRILGFNSEWLCKNRKWEEELAE